jgi:hypothetical protein
MDLIALISAAAEESEPSKTPFYICGGLLAAWAVVLSAIGLSNAEFPGDSRIARGVMGLSAVLVVGAMTTAVVTA